MTPYTPDPSGPIFISYRWDDGTASAKDAARRLRASGVPVWLDRDDLPPGETDTRLEEALASGISGAVLVSTPEVGNRKPHDAIHDIEAPLIIDTLAKLPNFTLVVLNTEARSPGKVDRGAPNRLYGRSDLGGYTQYSAVDGSIEKMGRALAVDRMSKLRSARATDPLTIDLQTRVAGTAAAHTADLIFRSIPPETGRIPSRDAFEDLQKFLAWLPIAVATEHAHEVALVGGAHLTAALALGAGLAQPSGIPLVVRATGGQDWRLSDAAFTWGDRLPLIGKAPRIRDLPWRGDGKAFGVLIDLVPTAAAPTFQEHLAKHRDEFARGVAIDSSHTLTPENGSLVVREVAAPVRAQAAKWPGEIHVFLRTPWVAAALLGALLNTVRLTLYEWDNSVVPPIYEKTITVAAGLAGGPITDIHVA
jgi:hypothetical protein